MDLTDKLVDHISSKIPSNTSFLVQLPNRKTKSFGKGKEQFRILIKSRSVYSALATKGILGVGEQFMLGNLDISGNTDRAMITMASIFGQGGLEGNIAFELIEKIKPAVFAQTKDKSLKDIGAHYDISNEFYELFLDPTMTYSCAYFKKETDSLQTAQLQKYEHICRKLQLKKGETLLDIGCGWGGMLIYAAQKYHIQGHGVTLSKNQFSYAQEKIKKLGLQDKIKIELKDYRDITGTFDKFVSIGMMEHVTEKFYDNYFKIIKKSLKPGGIGVLHTIGQNLETGEILNPWMETYIFPGTYIPSATEIFKFAARNKLFPQDLENLRLHYALTLKNWIKNFEKNRAQIVSDRGEKFARMWTFYLLTCRAGFVNNLVQLWQLTFTNGVNNDYPLTRDNLYSKN